MDASTASVAQVITTGDVVGAFFVALTLAGALGMIIFNMVMKRLDRIDGSVKDLGDTQSKQGRNISRIMTKLDIEEET